MSKFYAVKKGRVPGIYSNWSDCAKQVDGYKDADFKSFKDVDEATAYIGTQKKTSRAFYAVKKGYKPGIYNTWEECLKQVNHYIKPVFKKFASEEDAKEFISAPEFRANQSAKQSDSILKKMNSSGKSKCVAFVDGSYNIKTGISGYAYILVDAETNEEHSASGTVLSLGMRQVNGEITAAIKAVNSAIELGYGEIEIFYDYSGVEMWAIGAWRANTERTNEYAAQMCKLKECILIKFQKVKAHTGIALNEKADKLAKAACEQNTVTAIND